MCHRVALRAPMSGGLGGGANVRSRAPAGTTQPGILWAVGVNQRRGRWARLAGLRDAPQENRLDPAVGLVVRLLIEAVVFALLLANAVSLLGHAIRHAEYFQRFPNGGYFRSAAPTYSAAIAALLLGPVLQVVVFGGTFALLRRRRRTTMRALRIASWWLIPLDLVVVLFVYAASRAVP